MPNVVIINLVNPCMYFDYIVITFIWKRLWFFHFQKFTLLSSDCLTHVCWVILKTIFKCLFLIIFWNKWSLEKPLDLHIDQLHDYSNHFAIISPQKGHYPSPLQWYFLLIFIEINPIVIDKILKSHMSFFQYFVVIYFGRCPGL